MPWFKGNIHTHTNKSDGDADPEVVARWYRDHGYDFLVLTDHNHRTILDYNKDEQRPLMVPGEEVTANTLGGTTPIHVNGLGVTRVVEPIDADGVVPTIQANVDAIIEAGGIASINHPNYKWAIPLNALKQVVGASLVEIYSGVPGVNDEGAPGRLSSEELWDGVLTAGRVIFGVAVDDSHHYHDFTPQLANPGRGWVVVRAAELEGRAIIDALASGDFYASTGVTILELDATPEAVSLKIEHEDVYKYIYSTTFTGAGGVTLDQQTGPEASYRVQGYEGYVRATVACSSGERAWVQPVFLS